jgi:undecaprenyl-diphosphatase
MTRRPARFVRFVKELLGQEIVVVVPLLVAVFAVLCFIAIAGEVTERDTQKIDEWVLTSLRQAPDLARPIGPEWVTEVARGVSALGSTVVLLLVTLSVVGFLFLSNKRHAMWLTVFATLGGALLTALLKAYFGRPRPAIVPHLEHVSSLSFPSGHSVLAATVYLTLGALLAREVSPLRMRLYVLSVAVVLTAIIGVSRIFLGVHYPTDVLAGWAAGLAWSLTCWIVALFLQRRGAIEENVG